VIVMIVVPVATIPLMAIRALPVTRLLPFEEAEVDVVVQDRYGGRSV